MDVQSFHNSRNHGILRKGAYTCYIKKKNRHIEFWECRQKHGGEIFTFLELEGVCVCEKLSDRSFLGRLCQIHVTDLSVAFY